MSERMMASLAILMVCVGATVIYRDVIFPENHETAVSFPLSDVVSHDTEEQMWRKAEVAAEKYAEAHGGFEVRPVRIMYDGARFPTPAILVRVKGQDLVFLSDGSFRHY